MRNDFNPERFNDDNVAKAFAHVASSDDFDLIRYALLKRYAEIRELLPQTDGPLINRAVGKMQEIEWVLERFGEPIFGGLPLADGISSEVIASAGIDLGPKIADDYPGGTGSRSALGIPE